MTLITGNDNTADIQPEGTDHINHAHDVIAVGNAQIAAHFVFFNIGGVDGNQQFDIFLKLLEHTEFTVWCKTGQYPCGVVIVKEFSAKFQIQLSPELLNPAADLFRLRGNVFLIVKADGIQSFDHFSIPPFMFCAFCEVRTGCFSYGSAQVRTGFFSYDFSSISHFYVGGKINIFFHRTGGFFHYVELCHYRH